MEAREGRGEHEEPPVQVSRTQVHEEWAARVGNRAVNERRATETQGKGRTAGGSLDGQLEAVSREEGQGGRSVCVELSAGLWRRDT